MTFRSDTTYALIDPEAYDDEDFGEGYGFVRTVPGVDGCTIADCWIVNAAGERHPGYDQSPVPVRHQDVIDDPMAHLRRLSAVRAFS